MGWLTRPLLPLVCLAVVSGWPSEAPAVTVLNLTGTLAVTSATVPFSPPSQGCFTLHLVDSATGAPVEARYVDFYMLLIDPVVPLAPTQSLPGSTDSNGNGSYCYHAPLRGTWQINLNPQVVIGQDTFGNATATPVTQAWVIPVLPTPPIRKAQMDTTVTAPTSPVVAGDTITVHYSIVNDGQLTPSQYFFNTSLTGPASFVSAKPSSGSCELQNGLLCNFPSLPPQTPVLLDAVLRIDAAGEIGITSDWVAEYFASPLWEYFSSSGGSTSIVAVARVSDLSVRLYPGQRRVRARSPVRALIAITNHGPHTALSPLLELTVRHHRLQARPDPGRRHRARLLHLARDHSGSSQPRRPRHLFHRGRPFPR
jgi:hypothetical protein